MSAPQRKVNLLPESDFETSFWGKFLKWAITSGRYVVILTELVIVLAFLSRFKLDMQISNLNQEITGKKAVLDSQAGLETEFTTLQARLVTANKLLGKETGARLMLEKVTAKIPPGVKMDNMIITGDGVTFTANSPEEQQVGLFLGRLAASEDWSSLELSQISRSVEKGLTFSVELTK